MEPSYVQHITSIVEGQLEEAQKNDVRLKNLYGRWKNLKKKNGKADDIVKVEAEIEKRQVEICEYLLQQQIVKDQRERAYKRFMSGEETEKYDLLRDAINLIYEILDTLFMDMADIVWRNTMYVKLDYPKVYKECQETIKGVLKEEYGEMTDRMRDLHSEISDNLTEMILNKAKSYRNKINNEAKTKS